MKHEELQPANAERRKSKRFRIQAPAIAKVGRREIWAFTRDISSCGIYFRVAAEEDAPAVGESFDFMIKIPATMSFSKPCFITGRGDTIRTENATWDEIGIGAEISGYDILSELQEEDWSGKSGPTI